MPPSAPLAWMPRSRWDALVRGEDCPLCTELRTPDTANEHGYPVMNLDMSRLRLGANQAIAGYCVLICTKHVREPFQLGRQERALYFEDLMRAGQAVEAVFGSIKLNFQMLGNLVPHLHTHIIPRYYGDLAPGRPLDPSHQVHLLGAEEASERAGLLRTAVQNVSRNDRC